MVIDLIRTLISDTPQFYEETKSVSNQTIFRFAHYPVVSANLYLDNNAVSGTLYNDSGVFVADTPLTGTLRVVYQTEWFLDKTIYSLMAYVKKTVDLVPVGQDVWAMELPYYPLTFTENNGNTLTYNEANNTFSGTGTAMQITGTFCDIYNTVGTLLLLKGSMPERIQRDFASFTNWGDYPNIAKGLQDQAMAWFKM
jgi:hypothetical protein